MGSAAFFELFLLALSKHDLKPSGIFFWKFACDLGFAGYVFSSNFAPGGRLRHEAYNGCCTKATLKIKRTSRHMRSISKYMIVNSFCPFSNALISIVCVNSQWILPVANDCINYLIGYSMDMTFSPPLYQLVEAFFRARGSPRDGGPQPARAQKMLRPIDKGAGKRSNPLNIQSNN